MAVPVTAATAMTNSHAAAELEDLAAPAAAALATTNSHAVAESEDLVAPHAGAREQAEERGGAADAALVATTVGAAGVRWARVAGRRRAKAAARAAARRATRRSVSQGGGAAARHCEERGPSAGCLDQEPGAPASAGLAFPTAVPAGTDPPAGACARSHGGGGRTSRQGGARVRPAPGAGRIEGTQAGDSQAPVAASRLRVVDTRAGGGPAVGAPVSCPRMPRARDATTRELQGRRILQWAAKEAAGLREVGDPVARARVEQLRQLEEEALEWMRGGEPV